MTTKALYSSGEACTECGETTRNEENCNGDVRCSRCASRHKRHVLLNPDLHKLPKAGEKRVYFTVKVNTGKWKNK